MVNKIMRLKKGDKVKILIGKDRGKEGTLEYVLASKGRECIAENRRE